MKLLLPIFIVMFSLSANAVDCNVHKIFCKIKEVQPRMSDQRAMELSDALYVNAKKYKGDAMLAVAIGMQETSLRETDRKERVILFGENDTWKIIEGSTDICMFQFHVDTIVEYKINPVKLKNDLNYCVEWHFKLMNKKKRYCKHMDKPWACYHSATEKYRNKYIELVERFL